jgi:hypothetical protein
MPNDSTLLWTVVAFAAVSAYVLGVAAAGWLFAGWVGALVALLVVPVLSFVLVAVLAGVVEVKRAGRPSS